MAIDYKIMGYCIAKRRKELKLTQAKASEVANLSEKYWSDIENAHSKPSLETIASVCKALETTPDRLLLPALGLTEEQSKAEDAFLYRFHKIEDDSVKLKILFQMLDSLVELDL